MFTDNFNRSDESLEASPNYTLIGAANAVLVSSNALSVNNTSNYGGLYLVPDQLSKNQFIEGSVVTAATSFLTVRASNTNNYIGMRHWAGIWSILKCASGTFSTLGTYSAALVSGDVMRLEANGADEIRGYVNGVLRIGPIPDAFNNAVTRSGPVGRNVVVANWLDDLSADAMPVLASASIVMPAAVVSATAATTISGDLSFRLQRAIYAKLVGDTALMTLITGVYDHVIPNAAFPYVVIGSPESTDESTFALDGMAVNVTIHAYSRKRGKLECQVINSAIYEVLHKKPVTIIGGTCAGIKFDFGTVLVEDDGLTYHGVTRYRCFIIEG